MAAETQSSGTVDPGLVALGLLLRLNGVAAEAEQIRQRCRTATIGIADMLRCAKTFGCKARVVQTKWDELAAASLPAVAVLRDQGFLLLAKVSSEGALVVRPASAQPETMSRADLDAIWNGQLVVMARPASLSDFPRRFVAEFNGIVRRVLGLGQSVQHAGEGRVAPAIEPTEAESAQGDDSGLGALVILLRVHGIGAEAGQIRHRCGTATIGITEMLRCAKDLGLKARARTTSWDRLASTPLPGIAALRDGRFLILGKVADDKVLIQHPSSPRPEAMTRAEFEAMWDGRLVLMARRATLSDLSRRFDITWFLGAIQKYRYLLGEVLIASFFLQVFALVSPLFFQVIIDKVLVHRGMSTLEVLVIGLAVIAAFEATLGAL